MKSLGRSFQLAIVVLASVMALTACGGGGGGSAPAGASGSAVSKGVITAKGSILVNGIKYNTSGATITIDDNPGLESDLKLGMTVKVRGTSDDLTRTGTAVTIEARDALEGRIDGIDNINKTITVMGQTVRIEDNITRLNDDDTVKIFAAAGFALDDMVEVNGFADDNGGLRATRVAKKATGEFESKGFVTNLGVASFGLSLTPGGASSLTVNFTAGQLPAGILNGSMVEVKSAAAPSGGAITATRIKLEDRLGAAGEKVEVEGIVSSGTLANFIVNGQQVLTNASTLFEGGVRDDFATGVKLEAEGPLDANGAILATKISFRSNIKLEGDASSVSENSLTLLDKVVFINNLTRTDNGPIANGSHVEVRALSDRDGNLTATRITVRNPSTKAFLQGPVTSSNSAAGTLTILGTSLVSDNTTQWRVSNSSSETAVTKAEFFAQLKDTISVVKVKWDPFTAISAPVKEAEIELGK